MRTRRRRSLLAPLSTALLVAGLAGCGDAELDAELAAERAAVAAPPVTTQTGEELFEDHFATGNGRACVTCHVADEAFSISPAGVEARFQADPTEPLFRSIDADDFADDFTTLRRHALIRVNLLLPPTIVDLDRPERRTISVWRAVPPVWNVRFTAPYQQDGRHATLEGQALGAIHDHFEPVRDPSDEFGHRVAEFQRGIFSSPQLAAVARALDRGEPPPAADPPLGPLERQGKVIFDAHCGTCHSGPALSDRLDIALGIHPHAHDDDTTPIFRNFFNTQISSTNANRLPVHTLAVTDARTGLVTVVRTPDPGLALITGKPGDVDRFEIPPLRGLARSAPYFHDHAIPTLEAVIEHYARPDVVRKTLSPPVPLELRPALLAYLRVI